MKVDTVLQTLRNINSPYLSLLIFLLLLGTTIESAYAEVIDRIQINQRGSQAEIKIRFVNRIQYLRQVMLKNGDVRIYFNLLEVDATDKRELRQKRDSPPSKIAPPFSITYPEIDSSLTISFGERVEYQVRPGDDGRSISFFTPIANKKTVSRSRSSRGVATKQTEPEAKQLMFKAINALQNKLYAKAIGLLDKLLDLPNNQQTESAQYLIGQVYERNGELVNAREAYKSYVLRYPKSKDSIKVQTRLAKMIMAVYKAEKSMPEQQAISDKMTYFGGFSQYYSRSLIQIDTLADPTAALVTTNTSLSQLLSTLRITGLKRSESTETRLVLRDTFTASLIDSAGSHNFLQAAYFERGSIDQLYLYGAGRKTGSSGGLPNRFDGAWLGSKFGSTWSINGSIGKPVTSSTINDETKTFGGVNLEFNSGGGEWNGNSYFIGQRAANIMDRRAAGIEAHYFNDGSNHMALFEYDTLFEKLNIGLLQGNWTTDKGANYTLLLDQRRDLAITNALFIDQPSQTIKELLDKGETAASLRDKALLNSPISNQFMIGTTQPYSPGVKIGGDFRATNTTHYQAWDPLLLPTPGNKEFPRAWSYIYTAQVIGTNLLFNNDIGLASLSYTNASTYNAKTLTFSQLATLQENWQFNISLQYYTEHNNSGTRISRISPNFRLNYHMNKKMNLEIEAGITDMQSYSSTLENKTQSKNFSLGYRWDF